MRPQKSYNNSRLKKNLYGFGLARFLILPNPWTSLNYTVTVALVTQTKRMAMRIIVGEMVRRTTGFLVAGQVLLLTCVLSGAWAGDWQAETARRMQRWLQPAVVTKAVGCYAPRFDLYDALNRFYAQRDYAPAWVDRFGLLPEGAMALTAVKQAGRQGLLYADYHNPLLDVLLDGMITRPVIIGKVFNGKQIQLELVVTEMVLRYAYHRAMGRTDSTILAYAGAGLNNPPRDLAVELAQALEKGRLAEFFDQLGPQHEAYRKLQQGLQRYRRIHKKGGWASIDGGPKLQRGDCGHRVAQLRDRLAASGETSPPTELAIECFDDDLEVAVARLQRRHGLKVDGVVGGRTLAALNVPVEQRIRQIQLNLERWRWMPADLGPLYVMVNIPGFQMQIVDAGEVVKTMRAIVGRERRRTPVLSSRITYFELNPYWHVPPKIAREDLLPKIQTNPDFLVHENFRIFDGWGEDAREIDPRAVDWASLSKSRFPYRLRQEPAGRNALGRVKFMFPNELSVYIHDTPSKGLFNKASRTFSSGCVRVEEPLDLVEVLLEGQGWNQERLGEALASEERQVVILDRPVPVHLVYWTAWTDASGEVHFREDIYGEDRKLFRAIALRNDGQPTCSYATSQPTYLGEFYKDPDGFPEPGLRNYPIRFGDDSHKTLSTVRHIRIGSPIQPPSFSTVTTWERPWP